MRSAKPFVVAAVSLAGLLVVGATLMLVVPLAFAAEPRAAVDPAVARWAFAAAAAASAVSAAAAGYAVGHVGSAAVGAVTEKPELFGRMLILVGLAEGIAIYGLIVAVLIFNRIG